jgi:hypothetical protein
MEEKVSPAGKLRGVDYALSVRIVGRLNEYKLEIVKVTANSSHKHGKTDDLVPRGNNASAASNSGRRLDARARRRPVRTAVEQEALPGEDRRCRSVPIRLGFVLGVRTRPDDVLRSFGKRDRLSASSSENSSQRESQTEVYDGLHWPCSQEFRPKPQSTPTRFWRARHLS